MAWNGYWEYDGTEIINAPRTEAYLAGRDWFIPTFEKPDFPAMLGVSPYVTPAGAYRRNHLTNPSFEANTVGWTATNGCSVGVGSAGADLNAEGANVGVITTTTDLVFGQSMIQSHTVPAAPGQVWSAYGRIRRTTSTAGSSTVRLMVRFLDASNATLITHFMSVSALANNPSSLNTGRVSGVVAPANTAFVRVHWGTDAALSGPATFRVDAMMLEQTAYIDDYFDGTRGGWDGATDASTSTLVTEPAAPWYDPDLPESGEFFGYYPLNIDGVEDSSRTATAIEFTIDGGNPGRVRHGTKAMVFNGLLMASSQRGAEYGMTWLRRALLGGLCSDRLTTEHSLGLDLLYFSSEPDHYAAPVALAPEAVVPVESIPALRDRLRRLKGVTVSPGPMVTSRHTMSCGGAVWSVQFTAVAGKPHEYGIAREILQGYLDPTVTDPWAPDAPQGTYSTASEPAVEVECGDDTWEPLYDPLYPALVTPPAPPSVPLGQFSIDIAYMSPPTMQAATTATTGGTLPAGTYRAVVTTFNAQGETTASNEISRVTTGAASTITFNWSNVPAESGFRLYVTAVNGAAGSETFLVELPPNTLSYTWTGTPARGTGVPPDVNTAQLPSWSRWEVALSTQSIPLWSEVVPLISIYAEQEMRNVRLRFYADPSGLRDPNDAPCDYVGDVVVSYIPPGGTMILDGSTEQADIITSLGHRRRADSLVFSTQGEPFKWPVLSCGYAHILTIDLPVGSPKPIVDLALIPRGR